MEEIRNFAQTNEPSFDLANPMPHCPVVLVLDTSHSMWGQGLTDLRNSLQAFFRTLADGSFGGTQIDIAAVSMGSNLGLLSPFTAFADSPVAELNIRPKGDTPIGAALALALRTLDGELALYAKRGIGCVTPQLIVLSDGESSDDFAPAAQEIRRRCADGRLICRAIALGNSPDIPSLERFAGDNVMRSRHGSMEEDFSDVGRIVSQVYEDEAGEVIEAAAAEPVTPAPVESETIYLLDGSNILRWEESRYGISLGKVLTITEYFDRNGIACQVFFDATAPHWLKAHSDAEYAQYQELLAQRPDVFRQVPAQTRADDFLLAAADQDPEAVILSNDTFREYRAQYPWLNDRKRVAQGMFLNSMIYFPNISLKIPRNSTEKGC